MEPLRSFWTSGMIEILTTSRRHIVLVSLIVTKSIKIPHCSSAFDLFLVYLRTSLAVAYNRMLQRARSEEATVSMAYITELHELHESWLVRMQAANIVGDAAVPVIPVSILGLDSHFELRY